MSSSNGIYRLYNKNVGKIVYVNKEFARPSQAYSGTYTYLYKWMSIDSANENVFNEARII